MLPRWCRFNGCGGRTGGKCGDVREAGLQFTIFPIEAGCAGGGDGELLLELGEMAAIEDRLRTLIAVRLLRTVCFGGKRGDDCREIDLGERARCCQALAALGRA